MSYKTKYKTDIKPVGSIETLYQLAQITSDGDLLSKKDRDFFVTMGFVKRQNGFNIITTQGIKFLSIGGFIKP